MLLPEPIELPEGSPRPSDVLDDLRADRFPLPDEEPTAEGPPLK